ncbi:IclR family transcriptional regulator [Pseudarthrobacter phenanthrenivorans]|uniref:IclR family transcriptional regulator n=1 Tax=Pseudarthrobacter phenanthrenivorans TaxID=361575 RepID=UPI002F34F6ED
MTTLSRVSLVLDALAESRGRLSLSELAARTGLPRSSVHRTIQDLEDELYVVRTPGRPGYALGPGVLKFGMAGHLHLLSANRGQLVALARATNENAELAIFSGREVVIVDQVASPERLKGVTKVGRSFSLHASCVGKALLAALPPARAEDLLPQELERFTDTTVINRLELQDEVQLVRRVGVAVDIEEHDLGICALATAMTGPTGALQAIAVVMPTSRFAAKSPAALEALKELNPVIDLPGAREHLERKKRAGLG